MKRRRCPLPLALLFLGLVAAFQLQTPHASINVVWRLAVLSFDNPATQWLDELASDTGTYADPTAEARESARAALGTSRRLLLERASPHIFSPFLSSGFTRSPPVTS